MNRRKFIKNTAIWGGVASSVPCYFTSLAKEEYLKVTILHTNDMHSRIEPFPMDGGRNQGQGGMARRATRIKEVRAEEDHVLLFDSGDIFQGTPYFNYYGGELEIKLMNAMQYDAATLGNHDFDGGMQNLKNQIDRANFPFLVSNYDFNDTLLAKDVLDHNVFNINGFKIGVFGLGIKLEGLVPKTLYGDTVHNDPITTAKKTASFLKEEAGCDFIICLSHLGYKYDDSEVSDIVLAQRTHNIDLILGGHTHTFLEELHYEKNAANKMTMINQAGWGGILLGRIDLFLEKNKEGKCVSCQNYEIT